MDELTCRQLNRQQKARRDGKRYLALLLCLSLIIGLGTASLLTKNGVAQTYQKKVLNCVAAGTDCAHVHNEDCYDRDGVLVCPLPELEAHYHTEACFETVSELSCTLEESEGHAHTDACYALSDELVCGLEESEGHSHSDDCYAWNTEYVCGLEEDPEHIHDDSCLGLVQGELICPLEESEGHTHTESCYARTDELVCGVAEGEGAHSHDESCYTTRQVLSCGLQGIHVHGPDCYDEAGNLVCGQQELTVHVHGADCFQTLDMTEEEVAAMKAAEEAADEEPYDVVDDGSSWQLAGDTEADVENEELWQEMFADFKSSGDWRVDLLTVAESQLGYAESSANYAVTPKEAVKGYTRYGAWYGIPYGDWCAMFVSFCIRWAGIDAPFMPIDCNCANWIVALEEKGLYASAVGYLPKPGDLVFYDFNGDDHADHVGIVEALDAETDTLITIEGNRTDAVERFTQKLSEAHVLGWGILPERPADYISLRELPAAHFEKSTDTVTVTVDAPAGAFPAGVELRVRDVEDEAVLAAASGSVNAEVKSVQAVDITFVDADGNEIEPRLPVQVVMTPIAPLSEGVQTVVHVDDAGESRVVEQTENTAEGEVAFQADAFSVYAIVYTVDFRYEVDGKQFKVTVTYGSDAMIPSGSTLVVSELSEDSELYQIYREQTATAVGTAVDDLSYMKLLDISIMNGENKIAIQAPVDVKIELLDRDDSENREGEKTKVVHFGERSTDVIDPELEGTTVHFEATGFSYYAVTTYGATADLAGKSFAIVQVNTQAAEDAATGNNTVYQGRSLTTTTAQNNNTRLAGATVRVEKHESGLNLVSSETTQIVEWKFEAAGENNTYYIKAPDGKYLNLKNLNGTYSLVLSDTPQALTITAGTGNNAGKVRISNGNRRVQSSVSAAASRTANANQYFYNGNSNDTNYVYLTLCEIEEFDPNQYPIYNGEKVSVQNLVDGQSYIIYKNIYNEMTGEYEDWVIDGNGNPVKAYDQGDSLSLHSEVSPMWVLSMLRNSSGQLTGYYIFRNQETGLILHPLADGTLVKEYDAATSQETDGVSLKGRENGEYTSTIEYWDGSAMAYYGYQITTDGQVVVSSGTGSDSQAFSFAEEKTSQSGLHEVATVDSAADGITIHMFNYPNRNTIANVTGSDGYGVGVLPAQHVSAKLNSDGYPTFTNGKNGSALFNPTNTYHQGTGNHLFLESVYDSTSYYEYSAFNNFAHYNKNDGTFTVYQETGTPSPTSANFYFKRGNFFPYNTLNTNNTAQNIYTGEGTLIDYENPSYGGSLYGFSGSPDYYFGMTVDFNFLMPKDGYDKGSPLIYEFNGDDDLWVYIDGVLILDIGGVHDAFPGSINFATGEIVGGNGGAGGARTIKECFKNAGVFPDGSPWDDSKVDEYFNGDTFASYGSHQFNMFYMEHGAGASNLQMRFNLPVIERGKVAVEKQLDNTSQVDYANVSFAYQVYAKNAQGEYETLNAAVYEGKTDDSGNPVPIKFYESVTIDGKTYQDVFYLKPTEAAVFSDMVEDELYYVQEIGVKSDYYDEVFVNDVKIDGEEATAQDGSFIYRSSEATARNRARVTYTNHCNAKNSNELLITKRLAGGSADTGDTFEFRVMLENAAGELVAYYQGTYYIRNDEGVYFRYQGGQLVPNGETPYPMTAGNYGTIAQIPPEYTVVIKDLLVGTDFYVDEIRVRPNGSTSDVLIGNSNWTLVHTTVEGCDYPEITSTTIYDYATGGSVEGRSALGTIAREKDAHVTFTNKYDAADVALKKVKEDGSTTISGSTFDLSKYANNSWYNDVQQGISPGAAATGETPAVENPVDLGELPLGKYRLTETAAPDGYLILIRNVYFEVYKDTDKNVKVRFINEDGTPMTDETGKATITLDGTRYLITIINQPGTELPQTGGPGTGLYHLFGILLLTGAALALAGDRRHGAPHDPRHAA